MTQAKDTTVAKVSPVLRSGKPFETVIGKISLDGKGDVKNPEYVFYKWANGKYAEIKK